MKKIIIKIISSVMVIVLMMLLLWSCGPFKRSIFPDGYTGGWGIEYGSGEEIYWVETYEEALAAIEQLKSHGSTFYKNAIFSYEGDLFDTKYCFIFEGKKDNIRYGDNPYDRWAEGVVVESIGFFDDVTIDELVYSNIRDYSWFGCCTPRNFDELCEKYPNMPSLPFEHKFDEETYEYSLYYNGDTFVFFGGVDDEGTPLFSNECCEAVMNSIVFIGFDE